MKLKDRPIFSFKKDENGKFHTVVNGKTAFYWYQDFGIPPEMYFEEIKKMLFSLSSKQRLELKLKSWIEHIKEHPKDKFTGKYPEETKKAIEEIYKN